MKIVAISLIALGLFIPIRCLGLEPEPQGFVSYKGESLPLYDGTQVHPVQTVIPRYPTSERRNGTQGIAVIVAIVNVEGKVVEATVKTSKPSLAFGLAAKESVLHWRYAKMLKDGKPTSFAVEAPVRFSLSVAR